MIGGVDESITSLLLLLVVVVVIVVWPGGETGRKIARYRQDERKGLGNGTVLALE